MNFTAKVFKLESASGSLKGFAKVTIDGTITTDGWKIFEGTNGLFVTPPSVKRNGDEAKWDNTIFFEDYDAEAKSSATKSAIEAVVLAAYKGESQDDTRKQAGAARKRSSW